MQDLLATLVEKGEVLGGMIEKRVASAKEEYDYETDGEESETENEFDIPFVFIPDENSDNEHLFEAIPGPGVLTRSIAAPPSFPFSIENSDSEEPVGNNEATHPPLIRSPRLSIEEWAKTFPTTGGVALSSEVNHTPNLLSEWLGETTEGEPTKDDGDDRLFEDEIGEHPEVSDDLRAFTPEIEMATVPVTGEDEYPGVEGGFWYFPSGSTD